MAIHNYPKLIVPPFGKDDIKDIVQDGITNGEIVIPAGGTKLYKHDILMQDGGNVFSFSVINTSSTAFSSKSDLENHLSEIICFVGELLYGENDCIPLAYFGDYLHYLNNIGELVTTELPETFISDTVTELE